MPSPSPSTTDGDAGGEVLERAVVGESPVIPDILTGVKVTQKGQVTIPLYVRRALGITTGSDVEFVLDEHGARLVVDREQAASEIARIRGAGDVELSTEAILALTRG